MKERPILFNHHMVRSILSGAKSQTRRIVKPPSNYRWLNVNAGAMVNSGGHKKHISDLACKHGKSGDRLWVRETWNTFDPWIGVFYAADDHSFGIGDYDDPDRIEAHDIRWRPSIHMPRWASRIELEIVDVRVERLNEISEADAIAEGVERVCIGEGWRQYCDPDFEEVGVPPMPTAVHSFRTLWEHINGEGSWKENPFVWRIEFKRI